MHRIELPHGITYQTTTHVDVNAVAKSLVANGELIRHSVRLLEGIFPGVQVAVTDIRVGELSNASPLKEVFILGVFFAFQEELEREVPALIKELLEIDVPEKYTTIVTVLVLIVAITIIDQAVQRFFPGKDIKQLKKSLDENVKALAELTNVAPDQIQELIRARAENGLPKRLIQASLNFFLPAMQDQGVLIQGRGGYTISEEAVREVPTDMEYLLEEDQRSTELPNMLVDIHRSDRDSTESGWRGIIKHVSDRKIRLQLSPTIKPESLYGKTLVWADILLVEEKQLDGLYQPVMAHIMAIRDDVLK